MGAVPLIELVEDVFPGLRGNARALVLHGKDHAAVHANQPQPNRSVGRIELHGVADQVAPHVQQQPRIAAVAEFLQLHVELDLLLTPLGLQQQYRLAHLLVQAKRRGFAGDGLVLHLREQQDVADQAGEPPGVQKDPVDVLALLRRGLGRALQQHGVALDGVDGGLEFVGDVGDEVGLQYLRLFQLRDHHVEILIDLPDGGAAAGALQAHLEIAASHPVDGAAERAHGAKDALVQKQGDDPRHGAAGHQHPDGIGHGHGDAEEQVQNQNQPHAQQDRQAEFAEDRHGKVEPEVVLNNPLPTLHVRTTL